MQKCSFFQAVSFPKKAFVFPNQGGLAAAFDLAAYEGYMIARVKKSVNH